jgi:F-type H+-transporting ATPase subunit alpha
MMELLKQNEHAPLPFQKQVVVLFSGTAGYLDDVPVKDLKKFEETFLQYMELNHAAILESIIEKREITDDNKKALISAIEEFKKERM